jgi:glycosyltransferase involved in cell wall biosynthesis
MPTLHILSSPYSPAHPLNRIDAFSIAVVKYIKYMSELGWNCIHYGVAGCQVDCETVICLDTIHQDNQENIKIYNANAGQEIAKRKHPGDIILCFYGDENKPAAEFNSDLRIVEPSIGYSANAVFAPHRVFVSYAQMHYYYGLKGMLMNPSWNDAVIYNPITPGEFSYTENKDDYILYFGRIVEEKGLHIAIQATETTGKKLVVAGPGNLSYLGYPSVPAHVEVVGVCDVEQRKKLMSKARAIIGPTYYLEPFGNMIAEGYMSGTPAITTDWGGFTETVVHGKTGFRCREFQDFVTAINNIDSIQSKDCLEWALNNYEDRVVHIKHDQYLRKIQANNFYR